MTKRWIWVAGALSLALVGCGGGGGTTSPVRPPSLSSDYPGLANITTSTTLSTVAESAVVAIATPSAASAGGGATVAIDWTNTSIRVQVAGVGGQAFTQDFPAASLSTITIGGVPFIGTSSPIQPGDGSSRGILYTQVGIGPNSFDHTVLGRWTYRATIPATVDTVGFFVAGTETRTQDLPTTGTATYSGRLLADLYQAGSPIGTVVANASGNVNFGTNVFSLSTTGSTLNGAADASLNLAATLNRPAGLPASNAWSGTVATTDPVTRNLSGSINGRCYGPACAEFGATFFMNGTVPVSQQMLGGILLKQ